MNRDYPFNLLVTGGLVTLVGYLSGAFGLLAGIGALLLIVSVWWAILRQVLKR
jgi:hypothetical protein